jgi:hypothetical protein
VETAGFPYWAVGFADALPRLESTVRLALFSDKGQTAYTNQAVQFGLPCFFAFRLLEDRPSFFAMRERRGLPLSVT